MDNKEIQQMGALEKGYWFWTAKRDLFNRISRRYARNPKKILDVGCGTGGILLMFKDFFPDAQIHGIDLSHEAIKIVKERTKISGKKFVLTVGNAEKLPYPDESFDLIVMSDILEHVKNDSKAVSEVQRVLKKDGTIFVTVPMFMHLWGADDKKLYHFRRYTKKQLRNLFSSFRIIQQTYIHSFFYLPTLFLRTIERKGQAGKSFEQKLKDELLERSEKKITGFSKSMWLNSLLNKINIFENKMIRACVPLPPGVGSLTILRKKK